MSIGADDEAVAGAVAEADAIAAALLESWPSASWSSLWRMRAPPTAQAHADQLSPRRLLVDVASVLELDVGTLRGRDRTADVVDARSVAALLLRERCGLSFPAIGRELARRHTTAMRALARVRSRTRALADHVALVLDSRPPTRPALDVDELFRRAREDAGAPASAQRDAPR